MVGYFLTNSYSRSPRIASRSDDLCSCLLWGDTPLDCVVVRRLFFSVFEHSWIYLLSGSYCCRTSATFGVFLSGIANLTSITPFSFHFPCWPPSISFAFSGRCSSWRWFSTTPDFSTLGDTAGSLFALPSSSNNMSVPLVGVLC